MFAISDDQSHAHAGASGNPVVRTPAFDRLAADGVLFAHAFCSSPSCTPSRGAILTGQECYRLEAGVNLWSSLPSKFRAYPDLLEEAGYHAGYTRKGWAPGRLEPGGRTRNPAGPRYDSFAAFRDAAPESAPFCFWFGSSDPYRPYEKGSGLASGLRADDVSGPPFLPDVPEVRNDILDYYFEIERFDRELGKILSLLEERGELENTLVIATSGNGMPFHLAKADLLRLRFAGSPRGQLARSDSRRARSDRLRQLGRHRSDDPRGRWYQSAVGHNGAEPLGPHGIERRRPDRVGSRPRDPSP